MSGQNVGDFTSPMSARETRLYQNRAWIICTPDEILEKSRQICRERRIATHDDVARLPLDVQGYVLGKLVNLTYGEFYAHQVRMTRDMEIRRIMRERIREGIDLSDLPEDVRDFGERLMFDLKEFDESVRRESARNFQGTLADKFAQDKNKKNKKKKK